MYQVKQQQPGKVYRLTQGPAGYQTQKDFPPTEEGLAAAMRESRKTRNRGTGKQYGNIDLVESNGSKS
jgi:hypothetical protein